jgi:membrane protease YdiL (CAAX protease family)
LRSIDAALHAFYRSGLAVFGWLMLVSALELPILFLVVRLFHRRSWRSLVIGPQGFDGSGFAHSLGLALAIGTFGVFVEQIIAPGAIRLAYDAERFWPFLALAVVLVPLQTLAEETIFRGYVLQGVARGSRLFAVRLAVPALAFAVLHFGNAAVASGGLCGALSFVVLALYLTFLTLRGDGIEHAWGFHLGNNWLAFLLVASPASDFSLPSLFVTDAADFFGAFIATVVTCLLHYGLLLRFSAPRLARRGAPPDAITGAVSL